ncbi:MAG: hypothetical protein ACKVWR_19305 [Acidimicrobiales bacterium]
MSPPTVYRSPAAGVRAAGDRTPGGPSTNVGRSRSTTASRALGARLRTTSRSSRPTRRARSSPSSVAGGGSPCMTKADA